MTIRKATINDLEQISNLESICFPAEEAASKESISKRLSVFSDCFWVMEDNGHIISMINGMLTNQEELTDEMYADASMHNPDGKWFMIFGVDTLPEFRKQGIASKIMIEVINELKNKNKSGIVLTCKDKLIHFYSSFGYVNEGVSQSVHGGAVWYQMRLDFNKNGEVK